MSETTKVGHTPGPWEAGWGEGVTGDRASWLVYLDESDARETPIRVGDKMVAVVLSSRRDPLADADARLIAAAPEMLKALREAEAALEIAVSTIAGKAPEADWEDSSPRKGLRVVRGAIAKATGDQP